MPRGGDYHTTTFTGPVLSVEGLRKSFARGLARATRRTFALSGVDLDLHAGEVLGIVGPEGAGKTTLLQCICGLLRRDAGEVRICGELFDGGGKVPQVAYVPAMPVFYPFLTVRDVLEYRAARETLTRERRTFLLDSTISALALGDKASQQVMLLTRDELKRLAIAEALVAEPAVIVVDTHIPEPSCTRPAEWCRALATLAASGVAVMVAARDAFVVAGAATRLLMLAEGRVSRCFVVESDGEHLDPRLTLGRPSRFVAETMH